MYTTSYLAIIRASFACVDMLLTVDMQLSVKIVTVELVGVLFFGCGSPAGRPGVFPCHCQILAFIFSLHKPYVHR